jgi:hypothetical protein
MKAEGVGGEEVVGVGAALAVGVIAEDDLLRVAPEVFGVVGVGDALAEVAEEMVEPHLVRFAGRAGPAEAPLADGGGGVARFFQDVTEGDGAGREGELAFGLELAVIADDGVAGVEAGQ